MLMLSGPGNYLDSSEIWGQPSSTVTFFVVGFCII